MGIKARRLLKGLYFGILCFLLDPGDRANNPYDGSPLKYWLTKAIPHSDNKAAVMLVISGKVKGYDYKTWLRSLLKIYRLEFWLKDIDKRSIGLLVIGLPKDVRRFVDIVYGGTQKDKIMKLKKFWFNKPCKTATALSCIDAHSSLKGLDRESYIISFAGDTNLGDCYLDKPRYAAHFERLNENPLSFFEGVKPLVENSDYLVLNYASVLADSPPSYSGNKKYANWCSKTRTLDVFKQLGVTVVNLANKYSMGFGPDVMLETKRQFERAGINCLGVGKDEADSAKPLKLKIRGKKSTKTAYVFTGMYASKRYREKHKIFANKHGPGTKYLNPTRMKRKIVYIREMEPDALVIIFPHWQSLKYRHVTAKIKEICKELIAAGANYVLGHGTHMYECDKKARDGAIVYSLGNFVFNLPGQYGKFDALPYSVISQLELKESGDGWRVSCRNYPILSDNKISDFRPKLIGANEVSKFHKFINDELSGNLETYLKADDGGLFHISDRMIKKASPMERQLDFAKRMIAEKLNKVTKNTYHGEGHSNADLFTKELKDLGYTVERVRNFIIAHINGSRVLFYISDTSNTSFVGARIINDKAVAREFLVRSGVSIARGRLFSKHQKEHAKHFALSLPSAVVKPTNRRKGIGITVGVDSKQKFESAWNDALLASGGRKVLVEEQFINGIDARYLVIGGECVSVAQRITPHVIGNGVDTIATLIEDKNEERASNPHLRSRLIKLDEYRLSVLKRQGYKLTSVPHKDSVVVIDLKANFSVGGDSFDITDEVHPSFKRVAERAATAVPGLDVVGVDILAYDHTQVSHKDNYIVIEANTQVGLGSHLYPVYGKPRNVIKEIVDNTVQSFTDKMQ